MREAIFVPWLGSTAGLAFSGLLLSLIIFGVAYLSVPWLEAGRPAHLWAVGLGWLALALLFEFSFGFWQGKSLAKLMEAYSFRGGDLWPLVLGVIALAPYAAARLGGWALHR